MLVFVLFLFDCVTYFDIDVIKNISQLLVFEDFFLANCSYDSVTSLFTSVIEWVKELLSLLLPFDFML